MIVREGSTEGSLFPPGDHKAIGLFNTSASVNQYSFYGRCIGFHVSQSIFVLSKQNSIMTHDEYVCLSRFFPLSIRSIVSRCNRL